MNSQSSGLAVAAREGHSRTSIYSDTDVLIVGAGPVGLTLALLLAKRGRRVAVYERWGSAYPLPRAAAMSHETVRTFQSAGVLEQLRPLLNLSVGSRSAPCYAPDGEVLMVMSFPGIGESGYPPMAGFHQPDVDEALGDACDAEPLIELHRGWDVRAIEQDEDGAIVTFDPFEAGAKASGDSVSARAKFVVGCDGANSSVRDLMDTEVTDTGFHSTWICIDTVPLGGFSVPEPLSTYMDPTRPTLLAPTGFGRQRFEFMTIEGDDLEQIVELDSIMTLLKPWGVTAENSEIHRRAIYTFRGRWAENWRDGRVLLAGDAAHQIPPFLGQGLNSGARDAMALAWRLDFILGGSAGPDLLDSYTSERSYHVKQIIDASVFFGRMMCTTDPVAAEERNKMLRMVRENPEMAPPQPEWRLGPGCLMPDDPAAGFLAIQAQVEKDGRTGLLDDLIGPGHFVLFGNGINPLAGLSDEARRIWARLDGLGITIGADGYRDVDGSYTAWFEKLGAKIVLARPDFQVFGASAKAEDADALVKTLSECLQPELVA
ncbi:2-polyprenyl-6-methoxyphenol hydroxylase-like FAD-dependent oxidoreductase [Sphingomonas vulcanisoli]|uniref:2-polyprenyl-6-methoxyphenol hydroxylase-like FAD-dependent oxidoreductase n=1 Tax=Sphingomonas vulcanisoli TaxID=1658060 RepID=A0ABX0TVQ9_9SPHN|nr:bifunctional 3-(3-hydroxy-phenyl)propionate/3-hydroxycinnamic acid hydroxylase [Sphingomonas vulcanisoli]NIJ09624.1 2-polyprenyl-6-methoxyphenol hydroxylase-like FAD-dependent oxidoreductase [Sphingomonas vulcanisoli]